MADLSTMSDAELDAIINGQPATGSIDSSNIPIPADFGQHEPTAGGGLEITMTPHPALASMSDEELDKIIAAGTPKTLANAPTDTTGDSLLKGAGTAAIKGLGHIPGFAGDLNDMTNYVVQRAHSAISGIPVEELQRRRAETEAKAHEGAPSWINSIPSPPSGPDISNPILARTGEYQPTTGPGRALMAGVEGGVSMLGPGGVMAATRAGREGLNALQIARRALTGAPKAVPGGFVGGGAGDVATQFTGDPLAGMAVGSVVPAAGGYVRGKVAKLVEPYRPVPASQRQSTADARLLANTQNPQEAIAKLSQPDEIISGSKPRTAEVTQDPGHAVADELTAARDSQYRMSTRAQETAQNTARLNAFRTLSDPNADPVAVGSVFRDHLANIEADQENAANTARERAKGASSPIGPIEAEDVGARVRGEISEAQQGRYNYFDEASKALDPEGKLNAVASPITEEATAIRNAPDRDLTPLSPLAEEMVKRAELLKPVEPFSRLRTLDQTLTKAMKKARLTQDEGYEDIVRLKSAVKNAYAKAAENQVKWEQQAVARGDMATEDTFAHKLAQSVKSYYADRAGETAGPSVAGNAARGPRGISPENGAGAGSGVPGGGEGLPTPNLTPETSQRLAQFNKEYGEFRSLYGSEPIKGILKTEGFKGQYGPNDAAVVAKVFPSGEKGYETTSRALQAAQHTPQAVADMKAIAVSRLHNEMKGDTLEPKELDAWKSKYGAALRAIDEVSPGFSESFNNAASATKVLSRAALDQKAAVADAQKGIAAKFLGLSDADDIRALMGSTMSAKNSGQQITQLVNRLKGNPAALEGAKKAATDWLIDTSSNAGVTGTGEHILSTPRVVNFVRDNPTAAKALFGDEGLALLRSLAKDMERTQQLRTLQAAQGSPTAQRTLGKMIDEAVTHETGEGNTTGNAMMMGAMMEVMEGSPLKAATLMAGKSVMEKVSSMLEHRRGESLLEVHRMFKEGLTDPEVAKAMLERAVKADGQPNYEAFDRLMKKLYRSSAMNQTYQQDARVGRASGGKVAKMDYAAKAAELIKMAERAKKAHGRQTKNLLALPDQTIATALKLANQAA